VAELVMKRCCLKMDGVFEFLVAVSVRWCLLYRQEAGKEEMALEWRQGGVYWQR